MEDRAIDPMSGKNYVRFETSPVRFRALGHADGRQPFMPRDCLTNPCLFRSYPFCFADSEADCGRFPSGA